MTPDSATRLLTAVEAADRLGEFTLLDVREDHERAEGYIAPSLHIPLGELSVRADELDPAVPLLVYCHSGVRSAMAAEALRAAGYQAADLEGGMVAWEQARLPVASDA
ncbi:MAG: rhodanese-like protein [Conexibacter sp.]|jgi:rhodanese-related sulfurtransferase|nr:rhodanese-like protein [Conexibacter sp.]